MQHSNPEDGHIEQIPNQVLEPFGRWDELNQQAVFGLSGDEDVTELFSTYAVEHGINPNDAELPHFLRREGEKIISAQHGDTPIDEDDIAWLQRMHLKMK